MAGKGSRVRFGEAQRPALAREYDNLLACVRCGLCLTSCPTYVLTLHEAESPRGRVGMLRALAEGRLELTPDLVEHQQSCLVCDACTAVCPAGVQMEPLQAAFRATAPPVGRPWRARVLQRVAFRALFADMRAFRAGVRLLWLAQRLRLVAFARRAGLLRLVGLGDAVALLPGIPRRFVVPRGEMYPAMPGCRFELDGPVASRPPDGEARGTAPVGVSRTTDSAASPSRAFEVNLAAPLGAGRDDDRVSLFAGCVMSTMLADIDRATIRVLQGAGCTVENTAGQGCCGALHAHGGDHAGAVARAKANIAAFDADGGGPVIVNAAGCGAMLKDYARLLRDDPAWASRAAAFSVRVRDATELLVGRRPLTGPGSAPPSTDPLPVTWQDPCHLAHAQRITRQPRALLRAASGLELREMAESGLCCGSAGVYNLTNPATARQLRERKLDNALATGARVIVTANPGCLLHLRAGLAERGSDVQVRHIVEMLTYPPTPFPSGKGEHGGVVRHNESGTPPLRERAEG